jgi:hypothetical protein
MTNQLLTAVLTSVRVQTGTRLADYVLSAAPVASRSKTAITESALGLKRIRAEGDSSASVSIVSGVGVEFPSSVLSNLPP